MRPLAPRPLLPDDAVHDFDCGEPTLNAWLADRSLRSERNGDARVYVSVDGDTEKIVGYYTLSAWTVTHQEIGGGWLERNAPDPVSVILLGRLGVASNSQGLGLGKDLLSDALQRSQGVAAVLGARALVAEALDDAAGKFYERQGLRRSPSRLDLFAARLR